MTDKLEVLGEGHLPVAVDYLVALQEFAAERGISPREVLKNTGLPLRTLIQPGVRVGHLSMDKVVRNVLHILPDPLLPIEYGRRLSISKHGVLGYAAQSSETLYEAARLMAQYMKTRSGGGEEFEFFTRGEQACFRLYPLAGSTDAKAHQFHTLSTFITIDTISRWLSGTTHSFVPTQMLLAFDFPVSVPERLLTPGMTISFNEPANELRYPLEFAYRKLPQASPDLVSVAQAACEEEMELLNSVQNIAARVRSLIRQADGRPPKLEALAERLFMSPRTLKRRLHDAGTTYQHIKDSERFRKAIALLEQDADNLENIAEALGFSDASNFSKAFKGWARLSPGEYRARLLKGSTVLKRQPPVNLDL